MAPTGPASSPRSTLPHGPWRLAVVLEVRRLRPHRPAARARAGRRGPKERAVGILPLEGVKWAKPARGPTRASAGQGPPGAQVGDVVYVEPLAARRPVPPAPGAGGLRRHRGDGSVDRARARHGRRLLLRPEPVQPRDPGAAPAGLLVQPWSTPPRSTTAIRRRRLSSTRRSRSIPARLWARKTIRRNSTGPRPCASASSSRAT